MKFAIVLVICLAAQGFAFDNRQAPIGDEIVTEIKAGVQDVLVNEMAKLKQAHDQLIRFASNELKNTYDAIDKHEDNAMMKINGIKTSSIEECVQQQAPKIRELVTRTQQEARACVENVIDEFTTMYETVLQIANEANDRIFQLVGEFEACADMVCRADVARKLLEEMFALNNQVRVVIAEAVQKMQASIPEVAACLAGVIQNYRSEMEKIVADIRECAGATRQIQNKSIIEDIQHLIEQIKESIKETIGKGIEDLEKLMEELGNFIAEQLKNAQHYIEQILGEAREAIEKIKQEAQELGIDIQECIEQVEPQINEIGQKTHQDIQACIDSTANKVHELAAKVNETVNSVKNEFEQWIQRFNECSDPGCYVNVVLGLVNVVQKINNDVAKAIREASTIVSNAAPELITCMRATLNQAGTSLKQVEADFRTCFEDKQQEQRLRSIL